MCLLLLLGVGIFFWVESVQVLGLMCAVPEYEFICMPVLCLKDAVHLPSLPLRILLSLLPHTSLSLKGMV